MTAPDPGRPTDRPPPASRHSRPRLALDAIGSAGVAIAFLSWLSGSWTVAVVGGLIAVAVAAAVTMVRQRNPVVPTERRDP